MNAVNTVLGPVPADELGVVAVHEALLSVVPGARVRASTSPSTAQRSSRSWRAKLTGFRAAGGGTDRRQHRHVPRPRRRLYEALSRSTGVHIVASTGRAPRRCSAATS